MAEPSLRLNFCVDIVFCVDCTESMDNILNIIKERALSFYGDLTNNMWAKQKKIDQLRVRVVAFRDYLACDEERKKGYKGHDPMLVTDFFLLPEEGKKLEVAVRSLQPVGGGDQPEDGLEALAYAIRSDWQTSSDMKHRQVIVLWTDAPPHKIGTGSTASLYPKGMAANIAELTKWWGNAQMKGYMNQDAKRLILFAPDEGDWNFVSEQWDKVVHFPSRAGDGLSKLDYETILSCIAQSI